MRKTTLTAVLTVPATLLAMGCAQTFEGEGDEEIRTQQRTMAIAEWDEDNDGVLDADEFDSWFDAQGYFAEWDGDADGEITSREFSDVLLIRWDTNDDDVLNRTEWESGIQRFDDADPGAWPDWDSDGDSELDANELHEGLEGYGFYDIIGSDDDVFDDEEIGHFFFHLFDTNDDDEVDTTEWDSFEI